MHDVRIDVPGGHINVWHRPASTGSRTAVLVHGLSGTSRWWSRVIEHLPTDTGVVAPDLRGRGASHDSPPPYDLASLADDIVRSLDHLDITRAVVTGYSMGGWIVAICTQTHPERVSRAVLVDGGFPIPSDPDAGADEVIEAVVGPSLARVDRDFPDREAFFDYWKAHPALQNHWEDAMRPALEYELVRSNEAFRVRVHPEALRVNARQITVDPNTRDAGSKVKVTAHLIVVERGTSDQPGGMIPLQTAETAEANMPNLSMEYLADINHYTLLLGKGAPMVAAAVATS